MNNRLMILLAIIINFVGINYCSSWNYDTLGPDAWKINYPNACGNGQMQSPINIITAATVYNSSLANIIFNNYSTLINWNVTNNGHTS